MPNTKSATKALRQSGRRQVSNLLRKNQYKRAVKAFKKLVASGQYDAAAKMLPTVYKKLDKAAKTGAIRKNKASRLKANNSRLLRQSA